MFNITFIRHIYINKYRNKIRVKVTVNPHLVDHKFEIKDFQIMMGFNSGQGSFDDFLGCATTH